MSKLSTSPEVMVRVFGQSQVILQFVSAEADRFFWSFFFTVRVLAHDRNNIKYLRNISNKFYCAVSWWGRGIPGKDE